MLSFINLGRYRVAQFLLETNAFKTQDYNITNKYYSCLSTSHALQYSVLDVSMQVSEASFVTQEHFHFLSYITVMFSMIRKQMKDFN